MSDNLNTIGIRGKIAARTPDYRYTLPEGGNPGDIPVKTETGVEWQKPEPATTTPDWSQNDEAASDYIKNRPCYAETTTQLTFIHGDSFESPGTHYVTPKNIDSKILKQYQEAIGLHKSTKGEFFVTIYKSEVGEILSTVPLTFEQDSSYGVRIYKSADGQIMLSKAATDPDAVIEVPSEYDGADYRYALYMNVTNYTYHTLDEGYIPTIKADKLADGVLPSASELLPTVTASDSGKFLRVSSTGAWEAEEGIILNSSTAGSTKKFKITVDDTGTLSATEVAT